MKTMRIAILAYDGCMGTEVFGVADVLRMAGHIGRALGGPPQVQFEVRVIGLGGRGVTLGGGIEIAVRRAGGKFDLLVVPGLEVSRRNEWPEKVGGLAREIEYIRKSFAQGTPVAAVCIGGFLLGEAGLLAGRKVTTSWLFAREMARRYPTARMHPESVLVVDGAVTTTGSLSAAFDLAIHIVKQTLGAEIATATARLGLLSGERASQLPYVDGAMIEARLPTFSQGVRQWLDSRLAENYDLERLAQAFHVSARTLLRRVKAETGQSPLTMLQQARVEKAKQLLQGSNASLARIVEEVGYADVATFSRLFAAQVGETPAKYRRR